MTFIKKLKTHRQSNMTIHRNTGISKTLKTNNSEEMGKSYKYTKEMKTGE
jgi:hypothetical protein